MIIRYQLASYLKFFMNAKNISIQWKGNTMHLFSRDRKGITVFVFPPNYWDQFTDATPYFKEKKFRSVCTFIQNSYQASSSPYTHLIDIPCFNGCDWKLLELCSCAEVCSIKGSSQG